MNKRRLIFLFAASLSALIAGILLIRLVGHRDALTGEQVRDRVKVLQGSSAVPVIPNKSEIMAEVMNVEKYDFPQVFLTLRVIESQDISEFSNLLKQGEIMKASPHYIYEFKAGTRQIIFNHPQNIQNFQAYYVLPQDRLKGIARIMGSPQGAGDSVGGGIGDSRGVGGTEGMVWSLTDIVRIPVQEADVGFELSPSPVPIVQNRSKITGSILKVGRKDYPQVEVALRVVESRDINDFSNFLEPGVVITAKPYYLYEKGEFAPSEPQNNKNLLAYYLLAGDTIEAEVTLRAGDGKTDRNKLIWIISDLERVNHEMR